MNVNEKDSFKDSVRRVAPFRVEVFFTLAKILLIFMLHTQLFDNTYITE